METTLLDLLAELRFAVGYLGEKKQFNWWPSAFLDPTSPAFLAPAFPRSRILAQYRGVKEAAAKVHDERIAIGQEYHLFRLPEDLEQGLHRHLHDHTAAENALQRAHGRDVAMEFLLDGVTLSTDHVAGPVRVGDDTGLRDEAIWKLAAQHYARGFQNGEGVFPYFSPKR